MKSIEDRKKDIPPLLSPPPQLMMLLGSIEGRANTACYRIASFRAGKGRKRGRETGSVREEGERRPAGGGVRAAGGTVFLRIEDALSATRAEAGCGNNGDEKQRPETKQTKNKRNGASQTRPERHTSARGLVLSFFSRGISCCYSILMSLI